MLKNASVSYFSVKNILWRCLENDLKRFRVQICSIPLNLVQNRTSYRTISFMTNLMCFLWRYSFLFEEVKIIYEEKYANVNLGK